MKSIEEYCYDLEDLLGGGFKPDEDSLKWVAISVSAYTERLATALKLSKNSDNPQIRTIWQKLLFLSQWVERRPERAADDKTRSAILYTVAQVYQAMEWGLI
ncbi:hypothetical protein ACJV45_00670 [Gardnerella sp. Marseille-Q9181]|uniref:hypothetical protein n=1 Tax=Gardnerella sp. Marseille-Q9181 TaxID=3383029 RepID=UPI003AF4854E